MVELDRCTRENEPRLPCGVSVNDFLAKLEQAAALSERFFLEASDALKDIRLLVQELSGKDSADLYRRFSEAGGDNEVYRNLQECLGDLLYYLLRVSGA